MSGSRLSTYFPTFRRWLLGDATGGTGALGLPRWRLSPWWPGEGRAARQRSLLRLLASGVRAQAELAPLVAALAEEHRGGYRRALRTLARRLRERTPLADALEQTPSALPDRAALAVRFGTQSGTLAAALAALESEDQRECVQLSVRFRGAALYLALLAASIGGVSALLLVRIVPTFVEIFHDSGLGVPGPLRAFIKVGAGLSSGGTAVAAAAGFGAAIGCALPLGRRLRRSLGGRWFRSVAELRQADLLGHLGVAADAGRPPLGAVSTLARYHYDPSIRQRLLFVCNEAAHGADVYATLAQQGLLAPAELAAVERTSPLGDRGWTLRQLAAARRERTYRRLERRLNWLIPVGVLVAAAAVFGVAAAILGSLNQLTELCT